jgi:hypothetical protein
MVSGMVPGAGMLSYVKPLEKARVQQPVDAQ